MAELRLLRRPERTIAFISFPACTPHDEQVQRLYEQLFAGLGTKAVFTLRTSISVPSAKNPRSYVPSLRWFTILEPDVTLIDRTLAFADAIVSVPRVSVKLDGLP